MHVHEEDGVIHYDFHEGAYSYSEHGDVYEARQGSQPTRFKYNELIDTNEHIFSSRPISSFSSS